MVHHILTYFRCVASNCYDLLKFSMGTMDRYHKQALIRFMADIFVNYYHRLNGSSSLVLTATSLSYGEAKNSTPYRIKTPEPI